MKINKILAAGVAATLAVTSLSAVVSAETVTKSFDMGTSVATYKLATNQNWKSVDFLAEIDPLTGATIPSSAIVPPLVDGDKLVYDFTDAYFATWGGTVAKTSVKVNSVKLKVTGIQGAKNNSSKEYTYDFENVNNKNLVFQLTMNQSVGKGFIPTQFVEITKAEIVVDFQFDSTNETLFKRAKNSNDSNAEWGGGLQNVKVTTVKTAAANLELLKKSADEAQAKWTAAEAAYEKAKAEYEKAVEVTDGKIEDAKKKLDAAKNLLLKVNEQIISYKANATQPADPDYVTNTDFSEAVKDRKTSLWRVFANENEGKVEEYQQQGDQALPEDVGTLDELKKSETNAVAAAKATAATADQSLKDAETNLKAAKTAVELAETEANQVKFEDANDVYKVTNWGNFGVERAGVTAETVENEAKLKNDYDIFYNVYNTIKTKKGEADKKVKEAENALAAIQTAIDTLDKKIKTEEDNLKKPYVDEVDNAQKELDAITKADDTAVKAAEKAADEAESAYTIALAKYLDALAVNGDNIINVINGLFTGGYENASFGDITSEIRYAPLYKTTNNTTIGRKDVWALSITNDHYSDSYSTGSWYDDEANQSYNNDDVHDGTVKRAFAGLASQAADFFNKQDNGKIIFKFANPASTSSTWVNGGIPSTEVGLKSAIAGTNFGMFWNYNLSTGQLVALGQVDSDALTVTFDVSQILDDMGGLTKGNLADIYYGMNSGKTYGTPYNFTGYLVEKVTFEYDDAESETDAETETVDDTDDDTETVDDEDDDYEEEDDDDDYVEDEDDDDDYFIDDEDDDDDDDAYIEDEDDDDDDTAAIVVEDDSDDTDTNNDVVIVTPVKEDDDANPGTGVGLAVIPAIVAAAAMAISKKRK